MQVPCTVPILESRRKGKIDFILEPTVTGSVTCTVSPSHPMDNTLPMILDRATWATGRPGIVIQNMSTHRIHAAFVLDILEGPMC